MDAGKTRMNSVSRRTRSRWDTFYRDCHNEAKGKAQGRGRKSLEKQELDMISEDTDRVEKFEQDESSGMRVVKRSRRGAAKRDVSDNIWETEKTSISEETDKARNDIEISGNGDDEVIHLNEEVVSNGFSSKMESESRSGSESRLGSADGVVSYSSNPVENTGRITEGKNRPVHGRGRPQIRPLNESRGNAVIIDLIDVDSEDSGMNTDGSDTSGSQISVSDTSRSQISGSDTSGSQISGSESSTENDSSSDEDYIEVESSSSDDSEVSDSHRDAGRKEYVDDDHNSPIKINAEEDIVSSIHRMRTIHSGTKVIGKNGKKESDTNGENNGCYSDDNSCLKTSFDPEKMVSVEIIIDDEAKLQSDLKRRRKPDGDVLVEQGSLAKRLRSHCSIPVVEKDKHSSPIDKESGYWMEQDVWHGKQVLKKSHATKKSSKTAKENVHLVRDRVMIKMLADSINALREDLFHTEESDPTEVNLPSDPTVVSLPLKFRFEDEVQPPREKSEWEKEIDSLFCDLEMGLRECVIGSTKSSVADNDDTISSELDQSPAACCLRGKHHHILDEQIGIRCEYCEVVLVEIKHVLPPFYTPPCGLRDRKEFAESQSVVIDEIPLDHHAPGTPDSTIQTKGTVWDLMPGMKKELYEHQCAGFEFIWRNIAGDINIEKLKKPIPDVGRGCIISHAPGTGKTRLTIAFLLTFMKLYPNCLPVIVAPCGMLLTWEDEFMKWKVDIPFFNMNKEELSCNGAAANILRLVGSGGMTIEQIRLAKLYSWMKSRGILGISYRLFEKLAGDNERGGQNEHIKKQLLESPGILVLDEGHTARSSNSLVWKVLTKVLTQRRIMLTGTPFQNNFDELYNTLCLVHPKFAKNFESNETKSTCYKRRGRKSDEAKSKWMDLTSSICKYTDDKLEKLRALIDPFVHVHKGSILQESLPGMRNTLIFLHPSELQKTLLVTATRESNIFQRIQMVSLISVHPSLVAGSKRFSDRKHELEDMKSNLDAGVKLKFVFNLISLADAHEERVLVFSQFIDPLLFVKEQLKSQFSWIEGKQVLYMDGQSDMNHRQESISSFNDQSSDAKVLLASQRACSEGINLVGASRVVLIDTVWNPSVERQAISRAFRLGQKRFVYVYRLMTSGTEFMQYTQQAAKKRISRLIFSAVDEEARDVEMFCTVPEDKVLDAVMNLENFSHSFAKIVHHPKESDLVEILSAVHV